MAESEQISWAYVKLENIAEIFSAWIDSSNDPGQLRVVSVSVLWTTNTQ